MLNKFIERPVLSTVISIIFLTLGILGITTLPITQYPDIAPPTVVVRANYPGASAQTILENVISPIEEKINGVDGMTYITSTASNNGSAEIQVYFKQGVDPDFAAVNVQNRVALANAELPADVIRAGISTFKQQNSTLMYTSIYSTSDQYNDTFLENYLKINIVPVLKRIKGIGDIQVYGTKEYSMRIWLDPVKLANYSLTPNDVNLAIHEQSLEAAPGALGENTGSAFELKINYKGRLKNTVDYENIIIKANKDGSLLRLKDIAKIELDAFSYSNIATVDGHPSATFGAFQTPGSNAHEINKNLMAKLNELEKTLPDGVHLINLYNTNKFLTASIEKVIITLLEAFALVFLVVFLFLQDFRSTLIPAIAVPVSIVGTFFFLNLFGFSINLLTLFALILAIGIVVDDAIVVVEAVHAKLDKTKASVLETTKTAMGEISTAIISITMVMAAVFIPITFIQGPTGVFYRQFGLTLIIAILISAVNALTLSPALCALLIKSNHEKKSFGSKFFTAFNTAFEKTTNRYVDGVKLFINKKWLGAVVLILAGVIIYAANMFTPTGFVPNEDRALVYVNVDLPPGSSLDRTINVTSRLTDIIKSVDGVENATLINGFNFFNGYGSPYAVGFIKLKDWDERDYEEGKLQNILGNLNYGASFIKDANIIFFTPPSVPGFGDTGGFEVQLLDKSAGSYEDFNTTAQAFVGQLFGREEIMFATNSFNIDFPQYELDVDVAKTKRAGINVNDILLTMQGYFGGMYSTDFSKFGKPYKVFIQAEPHNRQKIEDLSKIFVRNNEGEMAPIASFVNLTQTNGPQIIKRFNLFNSASITGSAMWGYSTGDAINAIKEVAKTLPANYSIEFSGITKEEIESSGQAPVIIALSILFIFFLLAAQYESYLLPFAVILSLPVGVAGAFLFTMLFGLENNIYFQVALIMLLGLLGKNAILIVEFARQRREQGMTIFEAAVEGAKQRLRPIIMTSLAFIMGLVPLVVASGVGAVGNNSIGTGAAGGMLVGTLFGLFVIPALYVLFQWLQEKISSKKIA